MEELTSNYTWCNLLMMALRYFNNKMKMKTCIIKGMTFQGGFLKVLKHLEGDTMVQFHDLTQLKGFQFTLKIEHCTNLAMHF